MENVETRLQQLVNIQLIDARLNRIRQLRGGLPEEVNDLEDELAGLRTRIQRLEAEITTARSEISQREGVISECQIRIRRYETQLMDVRNNREFEALNKEIELENLEIAACQRKIRQFNELISERTERIGEIQTAVEGRERDLAAKQQELERIMAETDVEEKRLLELAGKAQEELEPRLLRAYVRIRNNMRNGMAVVQMDRGACGGCFAIIPPQRQYEVRRRQRLLVCENCGRILADESFYEQGRMALPELVEAASEGVAEA